MEDSRDELEEDLTCKASGNTPEKELCFWPGKENSVKKSDTVAMIVERLDSLKMELCK